MTKNRFRTDNLRGRASHITARRVGSRSALEKPSSHVVLCYPPSPSAESADVISEGSLCES